MEQSGHTSLGGVRSYERTTEAQKMSVLQGVTNDMEVSDMQRMKISKVLSDITNEDNYFWYGQWERKCSY